MVRRIKGERGMLVLLVVLLIPCALVSALVSCDESWLRSSRSTAAAFCLPYGCFSVSAAVGKKAPAVGRMREERAPGAVTVSGRLRNADKAKSRMGDALLFSNHLNGRELPPLFISHILRDIVTTHTNHVRTMYQVYYRAAYSYV